MADFEAAAIDPDDDGNAKRDGERRAGVLDGIRVLEFCHTVMGPTAGLLLADMGAEVIKIEPAPDGDVTRKLKGFVAGTFSYFNRNKKSIGINLKSKAGRAVAHRLVRNADVVIENYGPGTAERLGIGYDELSQINPRLIYCSLKGFLGGPYGHRTALDEVVQFMSGLAYMTGPPGRPLRAGASVVDIMGGVFGVVAILAALRQRDATGQGEKVQSALFETAVFLVGQHMAGERVSGIPSQPMPARRRGWAIYEIFVAADGVPIFVGLTSNKHWQIFCRIAGREDLASDERYASNEQRLEHYETLRPIVGDIVAEHEGRAFVDHLSDGGIPAALVARPSDLFDDVHLNAGNRLLDTRLTNGEFAKLPRLPMEIGGHELGMVRQPPNFGEHTRELLASYGYSHESIEEMLKAGVLA